MALVRDSDMTYCVGSYNLFCFQHVAVFILRGKTVTPLTYSHIWLLQWWYNKNSHIVKPTDRLTDSPIGAGGENEMIREKEESGKFLRRNGLKCWQDGTGEGTDWQCYSCATSWRAPFFSPPPICSQGLLIETGGQEERGSWRKRAGRRGDPSSQPAITEFKPLFHDFFSVK